MAFSFPGGGLNTYLPSLTDNLVTSFGRNAKAFAVNMICRQRSVSKPTGRYVYYNPLSYQRFDNGSVAPQDQFRWPAASLRPVNNGPGLDFEWRQFICERYSHTRNLDMLADQVADFDWLKGETENLASEAMAARAFEVVSTITTSGNYPSTHVGTATALGGGFWSAGTETNPIIKKTLLALQRIISLDSNGAATNGNLVLVVNPTTAIAMAAAQELHSPGVRSQYAATLIKDQNFVTNAGSYGLPDMLYGFKVVVMDVSVNYFNNGAASEARAFIFPDNFAALVCVGNGGLEASAATAVDTCQLFLYEDMKVELFEDAKNRIITASVTDQRQAVQVSGVTGGLVTNVLS